MILSIFIIGLISGGDTTIATIIAICLAALWTAVVLPYWMLFAGKATTVKDLSVVPSQPAKELK